MTSVIHAGQGQRLALHGRTATELASAAEGGYHVTVRRVVIPPDDGQAARGPHQHEGCEEVIAFLAGQGELVTTAGSEPVGPGDVAVISPSDPHYTRNVGPGDLVSLCFFAVPDLASVTRETI